ncbi:MAG: hypothetical protein WBB23_15245 [Desulforhopalus sp.]
MSKVSTGKLARPTETVGSGRVPAATLLASSADWLCRFSTSQGSLSWAACTASSRLRTSATTGTVPPRKKLAMATTQMVCSDTTLRFFIMVWLRICLFFTEISSSPFRISQPETAEAGPLHYEGLLFKIITS